jgi:signal transduction histidine kinase
MTRRLLISYLTVTALGLACLAIPLGLTIAHREKERLLFDIERDADAIAAVAERSLASGSSVPPSELLRYAARTGGHVIVVDDRGRAVVDTERPQNPGRDYSTRPEIEQALAGRRVEGTRSSETLGTTLLYAAVPATSGGRVNGAVRVTYPTATLDERVRQMWARLALLCAGVLLVVALVGLALARSFTRPVHRLERTSDRLANGDLSARVDERAGPPELRHLATAFNRMTDRLTRLLDAQQRFVADASHQLRTPLTALRLRLENLQARANPDDRARLDAAAAEVTRMTRLVDGLLVLARGATQHGERAAVDVVAVARERSEIWADVLAERNVDVAVVGDDEAWARVIAGSVEQLVDNLVDNALAVSPSGATITVRVVTADGVVELHVRDEGPGLGREARSRAFERFWRGADAVPGGSGLGLAIVQQLAEEAGGTARLDAAPGGGVDAVVTLPATAAVRAPLDV